MKGVAFWFVTLAILSLLVGMGHGIVMSVQANFMLSPAHGHLNLVGGALGGLLGVYYHVNRGAAASRLAWPHFALHWAGAFTLYPGVILAILERGEGLAKLSSLIGVASVLMFGLVHLTAGRRAEA